MHFFPLSEKWMTTETNKIQDKWQKEWRTKINDWNLEFIDFCQRITNKCRLPNAEWIVPTDWPTDWAIILDKWLGKHH